MSPPHAETIEFAQLSDGIVVIRVTGKGTHLNSLGLRRVLEMTKDQDPPPRFIFDLGKCATMDSTFMGTMASLALHQRRQLGTHAIVTNLNPQVRRLLETLGLKYLLDMRCKVAVPNGEAARFEEVATPEIGQLERIVMMINAHERLIDVDSRNEIIFKCVLRSLHESLKRERNKRP